MAFLYLLCHVAPSRSNFILKLIEVKIFNEIWYRGDYFLIEPQKLSYVQIKCRSCPVPLSLCVAAVSQKNSQCPLIVSEAFHAWKEECVTIISPTTDCTPVVVVWELYKLMSAMELFWKNFLLDDINSSDFSRLFCYLSNTRAQCLFPLVWYNIYGSFCSRVKIQCYATAL